MTSSGDVDCLVLGGGVVGMSIAYGLARGGHAVRVLDGDDVAHRASRGNFGLVWVQGKGLDNPAYARWTMTAAALWPSLARALAQDTGIDVELEQPGGFTFCMGEDELAQRMAGVAALRAALGMPYPCEAMDARRVRELVPAIGSDVAGAIYCPLDGHVNPQRLLRALVEATRGRGGELVGGVRIERLEHDGERFRVHTDHGTHAARRVVLAAGLGNRALAPQVGLRAPVTPERGQILVTERLRPFLRHPTHFVRQTGEGVVQIGDSNEDAGFDDGTTLDTLARIARRAQRCFPRLGGVNVVRAWGALRVMTPDGYPLYQASSRHPGAFVATCHSGITLAAMHAGPVADWIGGAAAPADIEAFGAERFHVRAA